jgi:hypothetical protein
MSGRPFVDAPFEGGSGDQYGLWRPRDPYRPGERVLFFTHGRYERVETQFLEHAVIVGVYVHTRLGVVLRRYRAYYGHVAGRQ